MDETLARLSAWPAVLCYAAVAFLRLSHQEASRATLVRGIWTAGWICLLAHLVFAMFAVHGGDWSAAYEHTAERTFEAVGWRWGGGLWVNLFTAAVWGIDVGRLWINKAALQRRSAWDLACQVYLAFMMFNATVIFGSRPAQIAGGVICAGLAWTSIAPRAKKTASDL